jgi:hypothetical protein
MHHALRATVSLAFLASLAQAQTSSFQPHVDYDLSQPHPIQSASADFDLDGNLDLIVTCEGQNGGRVSVLWGDGSGDFGSNTDINAYLAWGLVVDDFNGDGWPDFAVTACGWAQHGIGVLLDDHQRGFIGGSGMSSLGTPPVGLASADHHDGDDIAGQQLGRLRCRLLEQRARVLQPFTSFRTRAGSRANASSPEISTTTAGPISR